VTILNNIDDLLVGRLTFPLTNHLMNRRSILRKYRSLVSSDRYSSESLQRLQTNNLRRTLIHAQRYSSFYARRFREAGFDPQTVRSVEDLQRLPMLTREAVTQHRRDIVDRRQRGGLDAAEHSSRPLGEPIPWALFRKHRLIRDATSGSTGTPAIYYEDGSSSAMNWAHELRWKRWFGVPPGAREARFSRLGSEKLPRKKIQRWRWRLWHQLVLPGDNLSDADHEYSFHKLLQYRPRVLFGVTSALTGLADYLQRHDMVAALPQVDLVATWSAPLFDPQQRLLEDVFQAPVTNIYSSRELGHLAARCPAGRLHVNEENYVIEIDSSWTGDSHLNPSANGPGEIIVTPLFPLAMPFIRYRTGDIGQWSNSACPCGRQQRVIDNLMGRSGELYRTVDGRLVGPHFWCELFMQPSICDDMNEFQIVLCQNGAIRLRIAPRPSYSAGTESKIRQYLKRNLCASAPLEFEYVKRIEPHPSGKFQMVVSEPSAPQRQCAGLEV